VDIHYKFIGYVELKEMFSLPIIIPTAKDVNVDEELISEVKTLVG